MMSQESQQWDYRVIGININPVQPSSASKAARKMGENFSPEFLQKEFPEEYQANRSTNMALQCQQLIQIYGKFGWEHYQQGQIGNSVMMYFRRPNQRTVKKTVSLSAVEEAMITQLDPLQRP
jgi:hypothetical protein